MIFFLFLTIQVCHPQSIKDTLSVFSVVQDYADGWSTGDEAKLRKALHPSFLKRNAGWKLDPRINEQVVSEISVDQLVVESRKNIHSKLSETNRHQKLTLLSIYNNIAAARLELNDRVEILSIVRWNNKWIIINSLWEMKPQD
jgi:hypothetical protein